MDFIGPHEASGHLINLKRTDPRHFYGSAGPAAAQEGGNFGRMLINSLNEVNNMQKEHADLTVQSITNPDSVDPHDVTIAAAKANLSLSITKNVLDRVIQAYKEITNIR
jgi:flagellar hook-basal body complex protein FliE